MNDDKLLALGAELGRRLMSSGAEIYRVEESVIRLLRAYGAEPQVFAVPSCLFISLSAPDEPAVMRMCRIPAHGTDIELLEQCNCLCRELCRNPIPVEEAFEQVTHLEDRCRKHNPAVVLFGYWMTTAFFALFFGGTLPDCLSAGLCGLAVGLCALFGTRITGSNIFFRTTVHAALVSAFAFLLLRAGVAQNLEAVTIGSLMVLVPGVALTNAMREIMAGDIFSGLNRTAEVILVATAIALGTAFPLILGQYF